MHALNTTLPRRIFWLALFSIVAALVFNFFVSTAQAESFADSAFSQLWVKGDQAVANGTLKASWLWGPGPGISRFESYKEAPGGQRLVQYFDKNRMEINNPNGNRNSDQFVTNGLLSRELVSGKMQVGDNLFENRQAANLSVAGDLDSPSGPTYATFNTLASLNNDRRVAVKAGFVSDFISRDGQIGTTTVNSQRARYISYDNILGHNLPDVFVNWLNNLNSRGVSWLQVTGLPITEPYWAKFKVGGKEREVLVQLFERRALTFDPANDANWQVEMGNIGLHYYVWRYGSAMPAATPANQFGLDSEEMIFLSLINQYRKANNKPELSLNQNLINAAHWMNKDMASKAYFGHTDSLGRDPFKRIADFGYTANTFKGENLAAGYETASAVLEGWQKSPAHNENMLNSNFRVIGISRVYDANAPYKWYWTTDFGGQ